MENIWLGGGCRPDGEPVRSILPDRHELKGVGKISKRKKNHSGPSNILEGLRKGKAHRGREDKGFKEGLTSGFPAQRHGPYDPVINLKHERFPERETPRKRNPLGKESMGPQFNAGRILGEDYLGTLCNLKTKKIMGVPIRYQLRTGVKKNLKVPELGEDELRISHRQNSPENVLQKRMQTNGIFARKRTTGERSKKRLTQTINCIPWKLWATKVRGQKPLHLRYVGRPNEGSRRTVRINKLSRRIQKPI